MTVQDLKRITPIQLEEFAVLDAAIQKFNDTAATLVNSINKHRTELSEDPLVRRYPPLFGLLMNPPFTNKARRILNDQLMRAERGFIEAR